jgi:exportin-T
VTADFIALLYQFLGEGGGGLRNRAIECLGDIVCKGMKSREKIALIVESMMLTFNAIGLNVIEAVKGLSILQTTKGEDDEDVEFRERVAKFINLLGLELWKVSSDAEDDATVSAAVQLIQEGIFPAFMTLLADEYDDTSSALFPFTSAYLTLMKRIVSKKGGLDSVAACNFKELVRVVVVKMRYPEDGYTGGYGDEDEVSDDEALFQELRKVYYYINGRRI